MASHERNVSLRIQITEAAASSLERVRRRQFKPDENIGTVAYYILMLALQKPDLVDAWLDRAAYYCESEGVPEWSYLTEPFERAKKLKIISL